MKNNLLFCLLKNKISLHTIILYTVALLPVLLFILALLWFDSFAIVKKRYILLAFLWGICAVLLAPFLYPFILYIKTALMRGLGTAIMHCGAVAGTGAILALLSFDNKKILLYYIPAMILHVIYNSLLVPPSIVLIIITMGITSLVVAMILYNDRSIGKWLDLEMNSEVELLNDMKQGRFSDSKAGQYMLTISKKFPPEKLLDMYCYIQIYLEISLISKRNIMLQEMERSLLRPEGGLRIMRYLVRI